MCGQDTTRPPGRGIGTVMSWQFVADLSRWLDRVKVDPQELSYVKH